MYLFNICISQPLLHEKSAHICDTSCLWAVCPCIVDCNLLAFTNKINVDRYSIYSETPIKATRRLVMVYGTYDRIVLALTVGYVRYGIGIAYFNRTYDDKELSTGFDKFCQLVRTASPIGRCVLYR